jgi:putative ABC transport system permease protein
VGQVQAVAGVVAAAVTTVNPIGGGSAGAAVVSEDAEASTPNAIFNVNHRLITPSLLDTMGIRLRRGRAFPDADRAGTLPVVIVSEHLAQQFWPGDDPIGKRPRIARVGAPWVMVVGVADNVRDSRDPGTSLDTWYGPFDQQAATAFAARFYVMVRSVGDALSIISPVEQAIWRVDKTLAPYRVTSMDAYYEQSIMRQRPGAGFIFGLASFGLALAAHGTSAHFQPRFAIRNGPSG